MVAILQELFVNKIGACHHSSRVVNKHIGVKLLQETPAVGDALFGIPEYQVQQLAIRVIPLELNAAAAAQSERSLRAQS